MAVLGAPVGLADVALDRGATNEIGVEWVRVPAGGGEAEPVDLTGWDVTLTLLDEGGSEVWSCACDAGEDGLAMAEVPPAALAGAEWDARPCGSWRMDARLGGRVERLGRGSWALS